MKRMTRAQLRKAPLDKDCKKAKILVSEIEDVHACFCAGIWSSIRNGYLPKCRVCTAWNGP